MTSGDLDLWFLKLNIGISVTTALGNVYVNFDFPNPYNILSLSHQSMASYKTGQTDKQTGKTRISAYKTAA